jgi:hypothetical protein
MCQAPAWMCGQYVIRDMTGSDGKPAYATSGISWWLKNLTRGEPGERLSSGCAMDKGGARLRAWFSVALSVQEEACSGENIRRWRSSMG